MADSHSQSPLHQFEVYPLGPEIMLGDVNLSFTNAALWMMLAVAGVVAFFSLGGRKPAAVPGRWQTSAEVLVDFTKMMLIDNCGREGLKFFPIIFTLFMFVLFANLFGMLPYSFTSTSHVIVTFALAMFVFFGVSLLAIYRHGLKKFLLFFLPKGTPWWMAPLMYIIELISYLSRPISLSIRLAANMIVGHMILKIAAGFILSMPLIGAWLPFGFVMLFIGFEIAIAVLQAYIFTVLTCVYLNDALHLH